MLNEQHAFVLLADPDEVLDEVDRLEDRVLLASEHQSDEVVLFLQLFVGLVLGGEVDDHCVFGFGG